MPPWLCNSTQPQHTLQIFADHYGPRHSMKIQLIWDCNHKGSYTLVSPYLNIAAGISYSSFIPVSTRQLAASSLSKGISISIFTWALVLMGLKLATSCTASEPCIDWANFTAWWSWSTGTIDVKFGLWGKSLKSWLDCIKSRRPS